MDQMTAVADSVEKQTPDLMSTERKHTEETAVYNERVN
jgi:hypothetical protein